MSLRQSYQRKEERHSPLHQEFLKNFFYFKRDIKKFCFFKILVPLKYKKAGLRPVQDNKVVFMELTAPELSDNYKLIYNRLVSEYDLDIHVHFLMQGRVKKDELYRRQIAYIKDAATAKYIILNDSYNVSGTIRKRKGMHIMNTWHAAGAFKKFGFSIADKKFGMDRHEMKQFPLHPKYDLVTVSSPEVEWAYVEAMGKEKDRDSVKGIGISRSDIFYDEEFRKNAREHFKQLFPGAEGKKVILYAPTFRGHVKDAESPDMLDIPMLKNELSKDYVLVTKHHPFVRKRPVIDDADRDFAIDMSDLMSIEELLSVADICISDYSSLIFEFSLFEKPMIFYVYDLANYFDWRGFYYEFKDLAPGPICYTNKELLENIRKTETGWDPGRVKAFRKKFMSACDGHATDKIFKEFFGSELEKYKRKTPIEGDFSTLPREFPFYEYTERQARLLRIKGIVAKKYDSLKQQPVDLRTAALLIDENTDADSYTGLIAAAEKAGIKLINDMEINEKNAAEYAAMLAQASTFFVAGEPYILRMIDIRPETRVVELCPEGITFYKKWNESNEVIAGVYRDDKISFPVHTEYDGIIAVGQDTSEIRGTCMKNYRCSDAVKVYDTGNPRNDIFLDKEFRREAKEFLRKIVPETETKKVILMMPKERVGLDNLLSDFLRYSHEYLADEYVVIVDTKDEKLIPEYLDGYAVSPYVRLMNKAAEEIDISAEYGDRELTVNMLIAAADAVISDYREEAVFAVSGDKPLYIYTPDISTFRKKSGLSDDFEKVYEGLLYSDRKALTTAVKKDDRKSMEEAMRRIKDTYLMGCDGHASERLIENTIRGGK